MSDYHELYICETFNSGDILENYYRGVKKKTTIMTKEIKQKILNDLQRRSFRLATIK